MKYTKLALLASMGLLAGCEEYYAKKDAAPDGSDPYISISAPAQNSVFSVAQSIRLESLLSDKDKVKEIEVQVVKLDGSTENNQPLLSFKQFPKTNPVVIDTAFAAAALPAGDYLLIMNGIDGRTNVGTKEVNFSVKPD